MEYVGYLSSTGSASALSANNKIAGRFQAGSSFTATHMGIRCAVGSGENIKLGIYSDNAGEPDQLLVTSSEISYDANEGLWHHATISGVSIVSGTYYWLAVIADSQVEYYYSAGGTQRTNSDTYSDGFADPFGSTSSDTDKMQIYAGEGEVLVGQGLLSVYSGAVFETSAGTKVAVFSDATLRVYKNMDTASTPVASALGTTIFGGGSIGHLHAAIDSSDVIHIIASCSTEQTRDVAYNTLSGIDGTPSWGSWEEAYNYTEQAPVNPGCSISIDSNDYPHILIVDSVKTGGSTQDNVYYTERTGGSWATPDKIGDRDTKTDYYDKPTITLRNSDYIEASYYFNDGGSNHAFKADVGSGWPTESSHGISGYNANTTFPVIATTGGTVYRYHDETTNGIEENDVTTGYYAGSPNAILSSVLADTERFVLYIDNSFDIRVISNDGSGWVDRGDNPAGIFVHVVADWSYNNLNNTSGIDYLYEDDLGNMYWGEYIVGAPPPKLRPLRIWNRRF